MLEIAIVVITLRVMPARSASGISSRHKLSAQCLKAVPLRGTITRSVMTTMKHLLLPLHRLLHLLRAEELRPVAFAEAEERASASRASVEAVGRERDPLRRRGRWFRWRPVPQRCFQLTGLHVPQANDLVAPAGRERLAVRREHHGKHFTQVPFELHKLRKRFTCNALTRFELLLVERFDVQLPQIHRVRLVAL